VRAAYAERRIADSKNIVTTSITGKDETGRTTDH
jgi:hypothetical protein